MMRHSWQLILMWGFVVGAGTGFLATVLSATVAARWFTARRGLVVGILSGGAATGQLLFLPVMAMITVGLRLARHRICRSQPWPARSFRSCCCSCATGRPTWA